MAHLIDAPGPGNLATPMSASQPAPMTSDVDFADDAMDVDAHIVEDPFAEISALSALVSPNEKQFELFVKKVRRCLEVFF
jgi:hypothetical protein